MVLTGPDRDSVGRDGERTVLSGLGVKSSERSDGRIPTVQFHHVCEEVAGEHDASIFHDKGKGDGRCASVCTCNPTHQPVVPTDVFREELRLVPAPYLSPRIAVRVIGDGRAEELTGHSAAKNFFLFY